MTTYLSAKSWAPALGVARLAWVTASSMACVRSSLKMNGIMKRDSISSRQDTTPRSKGASRALIQNSFKLECLRIHNGSISTRTPETILLKFVDPEGEAIELMGSEEERRLQLEALRSAVGKKAGAYLYENKGEDGKYYVGVYTNGPNGKGKDFADLNEVAGELAPIIADKKVLSMEIVEVGTVVQSGEKKYTLTPTDQCNCLKPGAQGNAAVTIAGADENHWRMLIAMPPKGSAMDRAGIDSVSQFQMSDQQPGYNDWGIVVGHETGHGRARMTGDKSDPASLRLENKVRKLRDKNAPTREFHSDADALKKHGVF
jgi:hypothetical protein